MLPKHMIMYRNYMRRWRRVAGLRLHTTEDKNNFISLVPTV